jgi:transposase
VRLFPALEQALTGTVRDHPCRLLAMQWRHIDFLEQIAALNSAMAQCVTTLGQEAAVSPAPLAPTTIDVLTPAKSPPPLTCTRAVELLDTIPGVHPRGAEMIVAEIGLDMACFGTATRLAAWSGVAPGNDESARKQRSGKTRKGNQVVRGGLTQLTHAAVRTKGTYVSALYRRLAARRGKRRAILGVRTR